MQIGVSNPNVPIFPPRVCTLVLFIKNVTKDTVVLINSCSCAHIRCLRTRIYIEDMRTKKVNECAVTSERIVFIKTVNSNVMPTLRGFRWYPYFVAQE